ncbi:unnamed protein product [Plutella xylostella]|uniref:(diamondback moth) hypothetical protein n=1 Tax=Plutella xylostella TaxID=51655 RepID=A0A8S4D7L0_PLUXY|nr:unnamed protein product [Plutella xylostella]
MMSAPAAATCGADSPLGAMFAAAVQFFAAAQCALTEPWPPVPTVANNSHYDIIVVGSGTAGSVLARGCRRCRSTKYDWNYTTEDDQFSSQELQHGAQRQPRGRLLGGCDSMSDMVYTRGFPSDYEAWAAALGPQWGWPTVLEYFKKTERMTDELITPHPELMKRHGTAGELHVSGARRYSHTTQVFYDAFKELGFEMVEDMTDPTKIGVGRFSHTIRRGRRHSVVTALLNKAGPRHNLHVLRDATATQILFDGARAAGVAVLIDGREHHFYADKEVILSAGVFNTPKLLMLSGIGPREHLEALGVPVRADLPHLAAAPGTCPSPAPARYAALLRYLHDQGGNFSETDTMGAYMVNETANPRAPEFAMFPTCLPAGYGFYAGCTSILGFKEGICRALDDANREHELITVALVLLDPRSTGRVRLRSRDPLAPPLIYSGTFSHAADLARFPAAMRKALSLKDTEFLKARGARVVELPLASCAGEEGEAALACRARATATSAWHAAGTARAGAVLDAELRVRGVPGLRVVDASVMPRLVSSNTNAAVVMIAERAADFIKTQYGFQ